MSKGWISMHREIQSHWLWKDKPFSKGQAWTDLLLSANYDDCKFLLGNQIVEAKKGDVVTSEIKLMEKWGWSKSKVRAFLNLLEKDSMIVKKTDSKKTTLTLVNYGIWQDSQTAEEPQKDREETGKEPHSDTNNNTNNSNNPNKESIELFFDELWKLYPRKKGKGGVSFTKKKELYKIGIDELTRAVNRYIQSEAGTEEKFLKYGSSFFNSGYVDYLDENYKPKLSIAARNITY